MKTIRGVYLNGVKITDENKNKEAREELKRLVVKLMLTSESGDVDLLTDYLSLIIKAPLLLPYIPYSGKILLNNFDFLTSYIAIRRKEFIESGKELLEKHTSIPKSFEEVIYGGRIETFKSLRTIFEALSTTPADTRPGLNFVPLSSHLTLTSLIGWLEQPYSQDLPYLRLASILHDIGKLTSPSHHLTEGIKFMEEVINELELEEKNIKKNINLDELKKALGLIRKHHNSDDSIVKRADHVASSVDRLIDEVKEIIPSIEECKPFLECYEPGAKAECMEQIKYDEKDYITCTEKLYDALHKKVREKDDVVSNYECPSIEGNKGSSGNVKGYLYFIDFPGVQSFINYFSNLRDLSAASFLVDFLSSTVPFLHLDKLHRVKTFLPPEALLSSMGGHSYIVGRADVNPEDFINKLKEDKIFKELDVNLKVSCVPFYYDNHAISYDSLSEVIRKTNLYSLMLNFKEEVLSYGLHKVCDSCGIRPAVYFEGDYAYCKRCYFVHQHSGKRGVMAKLNSTFYVDGKPWEYKKEGEEEIDPMEKIAGNSNYISVIKFDGNDAGKYFKDSLTFGEYSAKSFWVDYAVKKAYYDTLKELDEEAKMIPVGTLYIGGDEGVIISPASISLRFVLSFIKKAEEEARLSFKVGVITAKYDHPIQFLINATDKLMEESKYAKSTVGVLTTSSFLSDRAVEGEMEKFKEIYSPKITLDELDKLVSLVIRLKTKNKLKHAVSGLDEALELYLNSGKDLLKLLAYLVRERQRVEDDDEKELYKLILKTYKEGFVNLLGYYHVLKTFILGEKKNDNKSESKNP